MLCFESIKLQCCQLESIGEGSIVVNIYKLKVVLLISFCAIFFASCTGGMSQVKRAVGGSDDVYIYDNKSELILHLNDWAGGEIFGRTKRPASFDELSVVIAESLKNELGKKNIYTSKDDRIPTKTRYEMMNEVMVPDWSKRNYKTLISTFVSLTYFANPVSGGTPPYSYKLRGQITLRVVNLKGDSQELLMPTDSGSVDIAFIERELELSTGQVAGLESLMKVLPPETILPELKEMTKLGIRRFVKEMMGVRDADSLQLTPIKKNRQN